MTLTKRYPVCKETKEYVEFYIYKSGKRSGETQSYCRKCASLKASEWKKQNRERASKYELNRGHLNGKHRPLSKAINCPAYLGVYIAERALSRFFKNITRMKNGNRGYDFLCGKNFKIDVKSSCARTKYKKSQTWRFGICKNKMADYFLCLAFDNRENLEPKHVWLIPGSMINDKHDIRISSTKKSLKRYEQYERPLDNVITCCNEMKKQ
jgi:hypothetical protein